MAVTRASAPTRANMSIRDRSRVDIFSFLHEWPDQRSTIAYATTGDRGDSAVIGYLDGDPELDFIEIASQHKPSAVYGGLKGDVAEACWLLCVGWSSRITPAPDSKTLIGAKWSLEPEWTIELGKTMYGHDRLHVGRFILEES